MGVVFAHNQPKTQLCDNFGVFGVVNRNMDDFLHRFITADETWIHHNTTETKQQSKQWVSSGKFSPNKAKVGLSAKEVMATVLWDADARGIIHIDYLQKGRTIDGEYYANLLDQFNDDLKKKDWNWTRK